MKVEEGKLEHREYAKNDGTTGIGYEINFGTIVVLERKADRAPAGAAAGGPSGF